MDFFFPFRTKSLSKWLIQMRFLLWNQVRGKNNYDLMSNDGRKCLFICHSQWWLMTLQGCLCGRLINPIWTRRPLPDIGQTLAGHLPLVSHMLATGWPHIHLATCWPHVGHGCTMVVIGERWSLDFCMCFLPTSFLSLLVFMTCVLMLS